MALRQSAYSFDLDNGEFAPVAQAAKGTSFNTALLNSSSFSSPSVGPVSAAREAASPAASPVPVAAAPIAAPSAGRVIETKAVVRTVEQGAVQLHGVDLSATPTGRAEGGVRGDRGGYEGVAAAGGIGLNYTPDDNLYGDQWHFAAISHEGGGIEDVWEDYSGAGVRVGVYDSGFQYAHHDLDGNADASNSVVVGGITYDDGWGEGESPHGTSVAGLIAAENNGVNTVGVAFGASITSVDIFDANNAIFINALDFTPFLEAITQAADRYDVVNNSWGSAPGYFAGGNVNVEGSFAQLTSQAYADISANGRDGLGTIIVKSAGNEDYDAGGEGINNSRHTITVGSVGDSGWASSYSNYGFNLLVSAQGGDYVELGSEGTWTTDLLGEDGYNLREDIGADVDYTNDFGGTSSAAPIISGLAALMLEANPDLGWRDVQNILAYSATMPINTLTGEERPPYEDYFFFHNGEWASNGATDWNGGGAHYNRDFGYGVIDAYNAVRMAEVWSLFADAQTSANEYTSPEIVFDQLALEIVDNSTTDALTFTITEDMQLEHLEFTVDLTHSYFGDVVFTLTSASGTVITLEGYGSSAADGGLTWTYGIDALRGESLAGDWTLTVSDNFTGDQGILDSVTFQGYGKAASASDVYHYTDEFFVNQAYFGEDRTLLTDTGGTDWINAAAMTGDVFLNLAGESTVNDEVFIRIAAGTVIERAVLGDGDDVVTGNSAANRLYGMRGDDSLDGGAGADRLIGGEGNDAYYIDNDGDVVVELEDEGIDTIYSRRNADLTVFANVENATLLGGFAGNLTGNAGDNILIGNGGNNIINGGGGQDFMAGGGGDDTYWIDSLDDVVLEAAGGGIDTLVSPFDIVLTANFENGTLLGSANLNITGNASNNVLTGNSGNNVLDGGSGGADTFIGGGGNDVYYLNSSTDVVIELAGEGTDLVYTTQSFDASAQAIENITLTGSLARNVIGNDLDNIILGNGGSNILTGAGGADTMKGGNGNDQLFGGDGNDQLWGDSSNDILDGGRGADIMRGGSGNDIYYVDSSGDRVIEGVGGGVDHVYSTLTFNATGIEIENLTLIGTLDRNLIGNELNNRIVGNSGNNILVGGLGGDVLTGGGGVDRFDFNSIAETTQAASDRITDIGMEDIIDLASIDADTTTGGNQAFVLVDAFSGVAGQLVVLYDSGTDTTGIYGDVNGDGVHDFRIVLAGGDHSAFTNFVL